MNSIALVNFIFFACFQCYVASLKPIINETVIAQATRPFTEDYVYVDKTRFISQLFNESRKRYFFARPKGFGKSTFLRTLQFVSDEHRDQEILKGTYIYNDSTHDWMKYPVMYFDLSSGTLETVLNKELERFKMEEKIENIPGKCFFKHNSRVREPPVEIQHFYEVLCTMKEFKKKLTVVLVDEYDHHILKNANDAEALDEATHFVRSLIRELRRCVKRIKYTFVTGITESSLIMITESPSGKDFFFVSKQPEYSELAGITKEELLEYFNEHVEQIATERNVTTEVIQMELKDWYGGYKFNTDEKIKLYNSQSVTGYFQNKMAKIYWTDDGRVSFMNGQMKRRNIDVSNIFGGMQSTLRGISYNINDVELQILLLEVGYFTVKEALNSDTFKLGFPNKETREAFKEDFNVSKRAC